MSSVRKTAPRLHRACSDGTTTGQLDERLPRVPASTGLVPLGLRLIRYLPPPAVVLLGFLCGVRAAIAEEADSLRQSLGPVASFTLTDQNGQPFRPEQLRGKVWVAHFFFTSCTTGCEQT